METGSVALTRAALLAEREHLLGEVAETITAPSQMTYGSQAAAASQVFEQQRDLALRDRASQHLALVDAALARLDAGTYGPCQRCGKPIAPDRLEALPWAAYDIECQRAVDRGRSLTDADVAPLVDLAAIRAAAERLRGIALRTPLVAFGPLSERRFVKAESLQPIGAFKLRGAYVAVASLSADQLARGVITYSSGNHAQGVARAARLLGAPAVVVMPSDAPAIKRDRVAADGAEIIIVGTASDERQQVAEALARERGLAVIPPFDDDRIIAGQGTVGLEIVEDLPDVAAILVPIGGGGLASGVATAVKALRPSVRVVGVEPEQAADARESLSRGEIVRWSAADVSRTCADGTRTQALGVRTFAHLRAHLDGVVTVSEAEIVAAVRLTAERSRLVAEPSGALSVAAMVFRAAELGLDVGGPIVAIVSGGNVDPARYRAYLETPLPG